MARIRSIKPEFWDSERLGKLTPLARLTFMGLISHADDEGRGRASVDWLGGRLHGYDAAARKSLPAALEELGGSGIVVFYEVGGCKYYWIKGFAEHQVINRPTSSKLPEPPPEDSLTPQRVLTDSSHPEGSREQGAGKGAGNREASRVTPDELLTRWNSNCGTMKPCRDMNSTTKHHAAVRLKEVPDLDRWEIAIKRAAASAFCTGQVEPKNGHKRFFGRFAWLVRPETLSKIEEGVYDDDVETAPRRTPAEIRAEADRRFAQREAARAPSETISPDRRP
jgi:hypothetical protein